MSDIPDRPPALDPDRVREFVIAGHGDFDAIHAALADEPGLLNASWDWGGGDWETALGGAAHMGRRDIALALLEHGARLDLFAAAMIGEVEIVRSLLDAFPSMLETRGPHGIPLLAHAEAGGAEARPVVELLRAVATA